MLFHADDLFNYCVVLRDLYLENVPEKFSTVGNLFSIKIPEIPDSLVPILLLLGFTFQVLSGNIVSISLNQEDIEDSVFAAISIKCQHLQCLVTVANNITDPTVV